MYALLDLNVEIWILIINYLDTKSKINFYKTSSRVRQFFAPCNVRRIALSRSSLATVKTLDQDLFRDLGQFIQILNLSGIPDLTSDKLKPYITRFENLITLVISFTDIYLSEIKEVCPPNLKNISLNFFKCPRRCRRNDIWDQCKELFTQRCFESVHFIVFSVYDSELPLKFLKDVPLTKSLTITVADKYKDFEDIEEEHSRRRIHKKTNFSKLSYIFRDCRVSHKTSKWLRGVSNLDFKQIEYIFFMHLEEIVIYASPIFRDILLSPNCSDFKVEICSYLPLDFMLDGNIIFKCWNKATTVFNEAFFNSLLQELKDYFPTFVCMHNKASMNITKAPSDWKCIDACKDFKIEDLPEKLTLTTFCRKDGQLIRHCKPIALPAESQTLHKITFLCLSDIGVQDEFFFVLFSQCNRLSTLNISVEEQDRLDQFGRCYLSLSRSIHLANTLKNFKLTSMDVEYETLFETLSRCASLENVHICEYVRSKDSDIEANNIIQFISNCDNLYSLYIEADMLPESLTLLMSPLTETAQKLGKDHLCIDVCECFCGWNPFADIFNPSPLQVIF